jgi:hypothetical protein
LALVGVCVAWTPLLIEALLTFNIIISYYSPNGNTRQERQSDKQSALETVHFIAHDGLFYGGFTAGYIIALVGLHRWLSSLFKSRVIVRKGSLLSQFSFQNSRAGAVGLAEFYVAFFTLLVAVLALAIR